MDEGLVIKSLHIGHMKYIPLQIMQEKFGHYIWSELVNLAISSPDTPGTFEVIQHQLDAMCITTANEEAAKKYAKFDMLP